MKQCRTTTCWSLIEAAAVGDDEQRNEFARRYEPLVRTYLSARWRGTPFFGQVDDACQLVFVECFRECGPLNRVDRNHPNNFRSFLYGIVRNIARRCEHGQAIDRAAQRFEEVDLNDIRSDETSLSRVFDRAWATAMMKEARDRQAEIAAQNGPSSVRRVELLQLRFRENLPIREIAKQWKIDTASLHREYAKARLEFKHALREVVHSYLDLSSSADVDRECRELLTLFE